MMVFHFYIEHKFDRLRTELMLRMSGTSVGSTSRSEIVLPPYHVQQMQPAPHASGAMADNSSLLPTVADIATDTISNQWTYSNDPAGPSQSSGMLPAYEQGDVFAKYAVSS